MDKTENVVSFCKFKYQCSKTWGELQSTGNEGMRYCPQCQQSVFLVLTDSELKEAFTAGQCIALVDNNKRIPVMTIGLPG